MFDAEFHRDMNLGDWQVKVEEVDIRKAALDRAIQAVGARNIESPSTHTQLVLDTAKQFEEYLRGTSSPARQQSTTTTEQRLMAMGNKWTHEFGCVLDPDHDGECGRLGP